MIDQMIFHSLSCLQLFDPGSAAALFHGFIVADSKIRFFVFLLQNFAYLGIWQSGFLKEKRRLPNITRFGRISLCKKHKTFFQKRKTIRENERRNPSSFNIHSISEKVISLQIVCCARLISDAVLSVPKSQNPRNAKKLLRKSKKSPQRFYYNKANEAASTHCPRSGQCKKQNRIIPTKGVHQIK